MILLAILGAVALIFIGIYNSLVVKRNQVDNAMAGIDVQLKKRYDLIPNLVETVKGYAKHEEEVLTRVVELRNTPYNQMTAEQKNELDNNMQKLISGLRVNIEQYPDLKASANFIQLQRSLNETEEQLSASRRSFNASVMSYNNAVQSFPTNIVAGMFGFSQRTFFEARAEERENVKVSF